MPELPEVETIRLDLQASLQNDRATSFEVFDRRLMSPKTAAGIAAAVIGKVWTGFHRKGKYLWAELEDGSRIVFHLRMTGQLIVHPSPSPLPSRGERASAARDAGSRLLIRFKSGKSLGFYDQRRFGEIWYLKSGDPWRSRNPLGPDALAELNEKDFVRLVKGKTTRIQPLLMDQRAIAGVGNIYAQEALF